MIQHKIGNWYSYPQPDTVTVLHNCEHWRGEKMPPQRFPRATIDVKWPDVPIRELLKRIAFLKNCVQAKHKSRAERSACRRGLRRLARLAVLADMGGYEPLSTYHESPEIIGTEMQPHTPRGSAG